MSRNVLGRMSTSRVLAEMHLVLLASWRIRRRVRESWSVAKSGPLFRQIKLLSASKLNTSVYLAIECALLAAKHRLCMLRITGLFLSLLDKGISTPQCACLGNKSQQVELIHLLEQLLSCVTWEYGQKCLHK